MVEAGANEVDEDTMVRALRFGHDAMQDLIRVQNQMREEIGKPKNEYAAKVADDALAADPEPEPLPAPTPAPEPKQQAKVLATPAVRKRAKELGVDIDELLISQPDTGEQALEILDVLVRSGGVDLMVVDSVAALVPKAEIEGEMGDAHMGLQARLMSQAMRKLTAIVIRPEDVADQIKLSDAALKAEYARRKHTFTTPEKRCPPRHSRSATKRPNRGRTPHLY